MKTKLHRAYIAIAVLAIATVMLASALIGVTRELAETQTALEWSQAETDFAFAEYRAAKAQLEK
jgi:hypothetical protein